MYLNNAALSNKSGESYFFINPSHTGSSSLISEIGERLSNNKLKVKTIRLDDYILAYNKPSVIKIDVEGAEKLVIEGGINFFKNYNPIISMEVWSADNKLSKLHEEAIDLLKGLGYKSYYVDDEGEIHLIEENLSIFTKSRKLSLDNYIFKKKE